ncbi:TPA: hypothetical protein QI000_004131 [Escherichia coli]|nr:hypothetical protein [Escherichia coli]
MKKTLIALAVAASAVVSGSAMAAGWEVGGTGGVVNLGGTLTVGTNVQSPWEVFVGPGASNLDSKIEKGQKEVSFTVKKIPVLGIRTTSSHSIFNGAEKLSPQIDFGDAIDIEQFKKGSAPLTLKIKGSEGNDIGVLTASLFAGAESSWKDPKGGGKKYLRAYDAGIDAFYGGLGKNPSNVDGESTWGRLRDLFDGSLMANYDDQGQVRVDVGVEQFRAPAATFSGFYGAGIENGTLMKIALNAPAASGQIQWKASLPVTVSYM